MKKKKVNSKKIIIPIEQKNKRSDTFYWILLGISTTLSVIALMLNFFQ